MVLLEYRAVLPFNLDEFSRGLSYVHVRHTHNVMNTSKNAEKVTLLEKKEIEPNTPVPDVVLRAGRVPGRDKYWKKGGGLFIKNEIDLGSRLPSWLTKVLKKDWLVIHENYHTFLPRHEGAISAATPCDYSFCTYTHPAAGDILHFSIESLHVPEDSTHPEQIAVRDDIFAEMSEAERKARIVEFIDITSPLGEATTGGVFHGDPTKMEKCAKSGRFPLPSTHHVESEFEATQKVHWFHQLRSSDVEHGLDQRSKKDGSLPLMTIYKLCNITANIPFAEAIGKGIAQSTIHDLAVHSFANMVSWCHEWYGMTWEQMHDFEKRGWAGTWD